jgi:hypothetical protein
MLFLYVLQQIAFAKLLGVNHVINGWLTPAFFIALLTGWVLVAASPLSLIDRVYAAIWRRIRRPIRWVARTIRHPFVWMGVPMIAALLWSAQVAFQISLDELFVGFCLIYLAAGIAHTPADRVTMSAALRVLSGVVFSLALFTISHWTALSPRAGSMLALNLALFCFWEASWYLQPSTHQPAAVQSS